MRAAITAGVKIAFGTDSGVTRHGRNLEEPALHSATLSAAPLLGLDTDLGSLKPGTVADLTIVDGDTLTSTHSPTGSRPSTNPAPGSPKRLAGSMSVPARWRFRIRVGGRRQP